MLDPLTDKSIRGFVKRIAGFVLLFAIAYVMTFVVVVNGREGGVPGLRFTNVPLEAPTIGGQTAFVFDEINEIDEVDILWIGSSHAYRTFDPRFFDRRNVSTFILGTTAQTPLNTFFLIEQFVDAVHPRVVILEVYWTVLTWDGVESTLDIIANSSPAAWMLNMAIATRDVRAVNAYLRRVVDLRRPTVGEVVPNLFDGDEYIRRGFVEKDSTFVGNRIWPRGDLQLRSNQLAYLSRAVQVVQERGIPIVLMTQPLPQTTLDAMTNHAELRASVHNIARGLGVPYVDFNGVIQLDDVDDFFDSHHLSQNGLRRFLPAVYDTLVELDLIPVP